MIPLRCLCSLALALLMGQPGFAEVSRAAAPDLTAPVAHGGGCRKSSPPGQCCHMDNSAGQVHCH